MDKLDRYRIRTASANGETDSSRYSFRHRAYDLAVLRYVAYFRVVTSHQVAYRFFTYAGKGARYAYTVIRRLTNEGLLEQELLDPEQGATSRTVLQITRTGWGALGLNPRHHTHTGHSAIHEYRLQFADVLLERESEGWRFLVNRSVFEALRQWALRAYSGRLLNSSEIVLRDRLEKFPAPPMPLHGLVSPEGKDVRLLLPIRRGKSFQRTIDAIPKLQVFPPIHFEFVCADLELLEPAGTYLKRWGQKNRVDIETHALPHFRSRPTPPLTIEGSEDRYASLGIDDPGDLL